MILNPFALTALFVGAISLLLIAASVVSAFYFSRRMKQSDSVDERAAAKDGIHLSFLLIATAFILRLASWPLFYIVLQSYVPLIPGAMCIFGVTQVRPGFTLFLEIVKPAAFFLIGGWLILYRLDLALKTRPLVQNVLRFLTVVSLVAAVDAAAELAFLLSFSPPGVAVSCCTAVTDMAFAAAKLNPDALYGGARVSVIVATYYGSSIGLLLLLGFLLVRRSSSLVSLPPLALTAGMAGFGIFIAYAAYREYLGPQMMGLPDHHCLYCLFQYQPLSLIIVGLFLPGSFLAMWPLLLRCLAPSGRTAERLAALNRSLYRSAWICLAIALLMTWIFS